MKIMTHPVADLMSDHFYLLGTFCKFLMSRLIIQIKTEVMICPHWLFWATKHYMNYPFHCLPMFY